jgi:hypothetical protein
LSDESFDSREIGVENKDQIITNKSNDNSKEFIDSLFREEQLYRITKKCFLQGIHFKGIEIQK